MTDLRKTVLAENVIVKQSGTMSEITFDFLCPNCGRRHGAKEITSGRDFSVVNWLLKCGRVSVRMPWAVTPRRDRKSLYEQ
jgi:predicted RNA-binding Zn-ribbon protein involved in translation (DUF1610 family)